MSQFHNFTHLTYNVMKHWALAVLCCDVKGQQLITTSIRINHDMNALVLNNTIAYCLFGHISKRLECKDLIVVK